MMAARATSVVSMTSWSDAHVILVGGRVLATPLESDELHCLSLIDGKLLWKSPRQEDLVRGVRRGGRGRVGRPSARPRDSSGRRPAGLGRPRGRAAGGERAQRSWIRRRGACTTCR